jgi:hypothetical protein
MCDQGVKIDDSIARYRRLRELTDDKQTREAADRRVAELETRKAVLHHEHGPNLRPVLVPGGKRRDQTVALPYLYGVDVNEELGTLFGGGVIIAMHIDAMHDVSVSTY